MIFFKKKQTITCQEYLSSHKEESVLLDVREQDEWDAGHIEGAQHIALGILPLVVEERIPEKETPIILCCRSGGRACMAYDELVKKGYVNLAVLEGGYEEYRRYIK